MLILPSLPSGHSIFCEDIRQEVSGTRSLIGVYGDGIMIVSDQPVVIPKLCIDITLRVDRMLASRKMGLRVIFETEDFVESELASTEFEIPGAPEDNNLDSPFAEKDGFVCGQLSSQMQMANVPIATNGRIKVRGVDGGNLIALGSLGVKFSTPDTDQTE